MKAKNTREKLIKIGIIVVTMICLILMAGFMVIPPLNENQTLYLSSTLAQVSATLFGITIAGYTFLEGKLEEDVKKDETLLDVVYNLKSSYRHILLFGSIVTGLAVFFCTLNIIIGDFTSTNGGFYRLCGFIFNCSYVFSTVSIISTILFTYKTTDPNRIKKASKKAIKESSFSSDDTNTANSNENYFTDFMRTYNQLEQTIVGFVRKKTTHESKEFSLFNDLNYLKNNGYITNDMFTELQQLRKFRNYLVHGDSMFVNQATFHDLKKLSENLHQTLSSCT